MCECLSLRNLFGLCWVSCIRLSVFASESDSDFVFVFEKHLLYFVCLVTIGGCDVLWSALQPPRVPWSGPA